MLERFGRFVEHLLEFFSPAFVVVLVGVVNSYSDEPRKFSASQVPSFSRSGC